ncbi:RidA family protein [Roseibium suaedae]|uniref:Enamine deaminase RidA, house cleaning of reactive enamine intermediates, YjgF/YER057c/UK114 family n=1 Tax=Roseibium suaedae TaxID=735517 RepID=A0A1M7NUS1_9HYPH|nr:RidA family protein [Roseibium suaedae]SHN07709.1 Enamine deaminase RidA, house cleaning of reactive enamine intermediates, YjgF/YER057c/UK114 family [Roseibium suaedae]
MTAQRFEVGPRMSQAVVHNGTVHIAGQVADNRKSSLEQQTREILAKIDNLLAQAGSDKSKLLSVTVLLPHITDFDALNAVYDAWIDPANPPARACFEARLADPDLRVEMTAVAYV